MKVKATILHQMFRKGTSAVCPIDKRNKANAKVKVFLCDDGSLVWHFSQYSTNRIFKGSVPLMNDPVDHEDQIKEVQKFYDRYISTGFLRTRDPNYASLFKNDTVKKARPIKEIVKDIVETWKDPGEIVQPYMDALEHLQDPSESYYQDSLVETVNNFTSRAKGWRGEDAERLKDELKLYIKQNFKSNR